MDKNVEEEQLRGLSQNSVDWAYNYVSIECKFTQFPYNVSYNILYYYLKFQMCVILAFSRKLIIVK